MSQNLQSPVSSRVRAATTVEILDEIRLVIDEVEWNEGESIAAEEAAAVAAEAARVRGDRKLGKSFSSGKAGQPEASYGPSYQEIKNLVWAKKHPVLSVALEEWDRKERLGSSRVDRREKRSADLINQIFNLVGFYSVFQGVVLTAVTQLLSAGKDCGSLCGKVWLPILLTVVAAVVTIVAVLEKFTILKELEESIFSERRVQGEAVKRGERVRREGLLFRFHRSKVLPYAEPKSFWKNKIGVIVSLVVFTLIFILAYFVILCDLWVIKRWERGL